MAEKRHPTQEGIWKDNEKRLPGGVILEQSHEGYNQATERARKGMLGSSCKEIGLEGWIDLRAQLYL